MEQTVLGKLSNKAYGGVETHLWMILQMIAMVSNHGI
jgi:hypothetical protein